MTNDRRHRIFVYGTLLAGEPNHQLLARSELLGPAQTKGEFVMLDLGGFPGVIVGTETKIVGEVYLVDDETLCHLDRLEGHPRVYRRTPIELEDEGKAEMYILNSRGRTERTIPSGSWRAHLAGRRKEWER